MAAVGPSPPVSTQALVQGVNAMVRLLCTSQDTAGSVAFANDNKTLFYVTKDKLDRPFKVSFVKL